MNYLATSVRATTPFKQSGRPISPGNPAKEAEDLWSSKDVGTRFGRRLKGLREQHRMTQTRMATKFGIDRSFISDLERGKKTASLQTLEIVALGFKVTLSDLFRGI